MAGASRSQASRLIAPISRSQLTFSSMTTRSPEARSASTNSRLSRQIIGGSWGVLGRSCSPAAPGSRTQDGTNCQTTPRPLLEYPWNSRHIFPQTLFHQMELFALVVFRLGAKSAQHCRPGREHLRRGPASVELDSADDPRLRLKVLSRLVHQHLLHGRLKPRQPGKARPSLLF